MTTTTTLDTGEDSSEWEVDDTLLSQPTAPEFIHPAPPINVVHDCTVGKHSSECSHERLPLADHRNSAFSGEDEQFIRFSLRILDDNVSTSRTLPYRLLSMSSSPG